MLMILLPVNIVEAGSALEGDSQFIEAFRKACSDALAGTELACFQCARHLEKVQELEDEIFSMTWDNDDQTD